jgi:transcriptional regulator with XRE-family HTH domain
VSSVQINGPALRAIRELSGVSCSALARVVGADVSFLARVERGEKRGIGRETFERVVMALRIDPRAILANPYGNNVTQDTDPDRTLPGPTVVPSSGTTSTAA